MKSYIERMFQLRDILEKTGFNEACHTETDQTIEDLLNPRDTWPTRIRAALEARAHAFGIKVN